MIYLDHAATSFPKAPGVADAMAASINTLAGNPGRAGHRGAIAAQRGVDDLRLKLARLFGSGDPSRVVLAPSATDALNIAIKGAVAGREAAGAGRPHIVTTVLEHNAARRPIESLARAGRIEFTRVDCDDAGFVDPAAVKAALRSDTLMIVMTHASNVTGTVQDIAAVGAIARDADVLFCVDSAQTAGVLPIAMGDMHIDLLAFPGHKGLRGPAGTGGLIVGERCVPIEGDGGVASATASSSRTFPIAAWREGGTGGNSQSPTQPAEWPFALEAGTPNTAGFAGLLAAIACAAVQEPGSVIDHERELLAPLFELLRDDDRFAPVVCAPIDRCVGTVSFNVEGYAPTDVAAIFDDSFDIAVRAGLHCAPWVHERFGTAPDGAVRVSVGPESMTDDIAALVDALDQIAL